MECLLGHIYSPTLITIPSSPTEIIPPGMIDTLHNKNKGMNQGGVSDLMYPIWYAFVKVYLLVLFLYLKREFPNSNQFKSIQSIYSLQSLFCYSDNKNFCKPTGKRSQ